MIEPKIEPIRSSGQWRPFIINLSLIIVIFLVGNFVGFIMRTNQLLENQFITTAKSHFRSIVLTRRWNANFGGVFVEKVEGVVSNPYLENPDIRTETGVIYTKKNPALMTREISEYAEKAGDYRFHITSLRPLNPNNQPDEFERDALKKFNAGVEQAYTTVEENGRSIYRYMGPLLVEEECLACHQKQGYQVGDVRGGISVTYDITDIKQAMDFNRMVIIILSVISTFVLLGSVYFLVFRLAKRLAAAYSTIEKMSITDELTQIYNRRYFHSRLREEILRTERYRHRLSLLLIDIDHFKKVNDTYGHQAGDRILFEVSQRIKNNCRKSDIAARYGGEEIVVILPETGKSGVETLGKKIRRTIECDGFDIGNGQSINITVSLGASFLGPGEITHENDDERLMKWADEALYTAKKNGRNRLEMSTCQRELDS